MSDPILDAIVEGAPEGMFGEEEEQVASGPYGVGIWKDAELADVIDYPKSDKGFGYRIGLKFNLKPGFPYTGRFDLPRTLVPNGHDIADWQHEAEERRLNFLKDALRALGFTRKQEYTAIDTDEQYNTITAAFRQLIGNRADVKVAVERRKNKETGVVEDTKYTKFAWIKAGRK